jgi:hypothetical protein
MPTDSLIWRGIHPPGELQCRPQMHNTTRKGREAPLIGRVRIQVQIQTCPRRQKGRLITSQRPQINAFWGEAISQVQGAGWKYCVL